MCDRDNVSGVRMSVCLTYAVCSLHIFCTQDSRSSTCKKNQILCDYVSHPVDSCLHELNWSFFVKVRIKLNSSNVFTHASETVGINVK